MENPQVPEAEGSGRGLKKSSKSAMGRREFSSEQRQQAKVEKGEEKGEEKEGHGVTVTHLHIT